MSLLASHMKNLDQYKYNYKSFKEMTVTGLWGLTGFLLCSLAASIILSELPCAGLKRISDRRLLFLNELDTLAREATL